MIGGAPSPKKKKSLPEASVLREDLSESAFREWQDDQGHRFTVCDTDKLQARLRELVSSGGRRSEQDTAMALKNLADAFPEPVLTEEQVLRGDFNPKPLFYVPQDAVVGTSPLAIKKARFHFFITDVLESTRMRTEYPLRDGEAGMLTALEAKIALAIFHPDYGDGFRSEDGFLYVRRGDEREYKRFSGTFLEEIGVHKDYLTFATTKTDPASARNVRDGIRAELPHLVKSGAINPEKDLKQRLLGTDEGKAVERVGVSNNGSRMIRGVLHYIGKQFYGKPVRIKEMSPTLGCVIDESSDPPRITHTFNIVSREQAKIGKDGFGLAGAALTQVKPFSAEAFGVTKTPGESPREYERRLEAADRVIAHTFLNASGGMSATRMELFRQFVHDYGYWGLRSFLACEYHGTDLGEAIMSFGYAHMRDEDERTANMVFLHFGRLLDQIDGLSAYFEKRFGRPADAQLLERAAEQIRQRAARFLRSLITGNESYEGIVRAIEHAREDVVRYASAYAAVWKDTRGKFDPTKLEGYEVYSSRELSGQAETISEMQQILRANYAGHYKDDPAFVDEVESYLTDALKNPNTTFHLLRENGNIIGFMRFDVQRDGKGNPTEVYFGSFNVAGMFGGANIGESLFDAVMRSYKELGVPIRAHCDPKSPISQRIYLAPGRGGFVQEGEPEMISKQSIIQIVWDPKKERA